MSDCKCHKISQRLFQSLKSGGKCYSDVAPYTTEIITFVSIHRFASCIFARSVVIAPRLCVRRSKSTARLRLFGENVRRPSMRTKQHMSGIYLTHSLKRHTRCYFTLQPRKTLDMEIFPILSHRHFRHVFSALCCG